MTEPLPDTLQIGLWMRLEEVREEVLPAPVVPPMWRVLHDAELGKVRQEVLDRGVPLPEVNQLFPANSFTKLSYSFQMLIKHLNSLMTGAEVRKLLGCHRFITNNHGFDCSERKHGPFRDFINARNLDAEELPAIEALVCGGALLSGVETTYQGTPHLLVDTIDGRQSAPSVEWVKARPWLYFAAVSVRPDGGVQSFSITPGPEYVPLVASVPVYYPLSKLRKLTEQETRELLEL